MTYICWPLDRFLKYLWYSLRLPPWLNNYLTEALTVELYYRTHPSLQFLRMPMTVMGEESIKWIPGMNDAILLLFEITRGKNVRFPVIVKEIRYWNEKAVIWLLPYVFRS